jgi:hypothetical protein
MKRVERSDGAYLKVFLEKVGKKVKKKLPAQKKEPIFMANQKI